MGVQLIRFAKPPTLAVTDPRPGRRSTSPRTPRRTPCAGRRSRTRTITRRRGAAGAALPRVGRLRGQLERRRRAAPRPQPVRHHRPRPGHRQDRRARRRACSSRCRSSSSRRRRSTVDSPAEGAQFENGAIPVKGSTTNAKTVAISAVPRPAPPTARRRPAPRPVGAPARGAGRRAEDRQRRQRRQLRLAARPRGRQVADRRDRDLGRGQVGRAHPQRLDQVQGREPGRRDQGLARLAEGLGRRQGVGRHRRGGPGLRPGQGR